MKIDLLDSKSKAVLDAMPDPLLVLDDKGVILASNQKTQIFLGYRCDELSGHVFSKLAERDHHANLQTLLSCSSRNSTPTRHHHDYPFLIRHKNGSCLPVRGIFQVIESGQTPLVLACLREITELKYRALFDSANDAIFIMQNRVFTDCNQTALQMLGYHRQQIIGCSLIDFSTSNQPSGSDPGAELNNRLTAALGNAPQFFEWVLQQKNGAELTAEISLNKFEVLGEEYILTNVRDITERKHTEALLRRQANFNPVTGLPNRVLALDRVSQALARATREKHAIGVLYIDIDHFKKVNDTLGHDFGDKLLIEIAKRLNSCVREIDTVAHLGGDEFLIVLSQLHKIVESKIIAGKILEKISKPYYVDGHELFLAASIGITGYPDDGQDPHLLLKNADAAMYRAKKHGRNTYRFFTQEINNQAMARLEMESCLRYAIEKQELHLNFQPQIDIRTGKLTGAEALLRWNNPKLGQVPPLQFIPIAEETGLIVTIGEWVLRHACKESRIWQDQYGVKIKVSVNVSTRQFQAGKLTETVSRILHETGLQPELLELELTESLLLEDAPNTQETLKALKSMGVTLSLDDFGTGFSSLSYLKRFPFDILKIDRSFVRDIATDQSDAALCAAIIAMASSLNLRVIGEGVEDKIQLEFLRNKGADIIQGYFFSRPLSVEEFRNYISSSL